MEFRAQARYMRVSPQKARLVLNLIKGRRVEEARNTLAFTKKRVAATVGKLLQSAIDNANFLSTEKGLDVDLDSLYVKHAVANDGPRMKRIRPAPMGRAYHYVRRIAHIEIVLAEKNKNGAVVETHPAGVRRRLLPPSLRLKLRLKLRRRLRRKRLARRLRLRNRAQRFQSFKVSEFQGKGQSSGGFTLKPCNPETLKLGSQKV
jgi:large subunit ribosomal protein L22